MTQYIQESLPNFDREMAKIQRREIGEEATQMHLAREFCRWSKYAKFSKDPEFKKRCEAQKMFIATKLMVGKYER